jgi:hypothetical protein
MKSTPTLLIWLAFEPALLLLPPSSVRLFREIRVERVVGRRDRAGNDRQQLIIIASVEREIIDLLTVDDLADFARRRVDRFARLLHDLHDFRDLSGFEREIDRQATVGVQNVARHDAFLKVRRFDRNRVGRDRQVRDRVKSVVVRRHRARQIRRRIGNHDGRAGDDRAGRIRDRARNAPDIGLRRRGRDTDHYQKKQDREK